MFKKPSKFLEKRSKMLTATTMFRQLALPLQPGDSVKSQINRAARQAGFGPSRAKTLWYGLCNLWHHEYEQLCDAYEQHLAKKERELEEEITQIRARRTAREMEKRQYAFAQIDTKTRASSSLDAMGANGRGCVDTGTQS